MAAEIKTLDDIQKANKELEDHLKAAEDLMRQIKVVIPESGAGSLPHRIAEKLLLTIRSTREELDDFSKSRSLRNLKLAAYVQNKYNVKYCNLT